MGVLYILDEPSIGLHQRDNARLLVTLKTMRDLGNTLIVVEHDEETIRSADYVVDIGPGAGEHGGEVVAIGTPEEIAQNEKSITGAYLSGRMSIPVPEMRRKGSGKFLTVRGARHNLQNDDIRFRWSSSASPRIRQRKIETSTKSSKSPLFAINTAPYPAGRSRLH